MRALHPGPAPDRGVMAGDPVGVGRSRGVIDALCEQPIRGASAGIAVRAERLPEEEGKRGRPARRGDHGGRTERAVGALEPRQTIRRARRRSRGSPGLARCPSPGGRAPPGLSTRRPWARLDDRPTLRRRRAPGGCAGRSRSRAIPSSSRFASRCGSIFLTLGHSSQFRASDAPNPRRGKRSLEAAPRFDTWEDRGLGFSRPKRTPTDPRAQPQESRTRYRAPARVDRGTERLSSSLPRS